MPNGGIFYGKETLFRVERCGGNVFVFLFCNVALFRIRLTFSVLSVLNGNLYHTIFLALKESISLFYLA
mgnify:CR=1 FL=1